MKASKRTKHYKRMSTITGILSFLLMAGPITYYFIYALIYSFHTEQKLVLGFIFISALILTIVNLLLKFKPRSPFWIMLLGLSYILTSIEQVIIIMTITCFIDEFIISPLHKYAHSKASINKEIDKRGT